MSKTADRILKLEQEIKKLKLHPKLHEHKLVFYRLGESSIEGDYYIQHVCSECNKIVQRSLTSYEKQVLKIK